MRGESHKIGAGNGRTVVSMYMYISVGRDKVLGHAKDYWSGVWTTTPSKPLK
jgi:hypothetical protein